VSSVRNTAVKFESEYTAKKQNMISIKRCPSAKSTSDQDETVKLPEIVPGASMKSILE